MTAANDFRSTANGLPLRLQTGQAAIHLPEVQAMLRKLSAYELGIFMPHRHDERTAEFQPLPDDVVQVESGLQVSFQPLTEIATRADRFLPVGWLWRAGAPTVAAACEMVSQAGPGAAERPIKHKMKSEG